MCCMTDKTMEGCSLGLNGLMKSYLELDDGDNDDDDDDYSRKHTCTFKIKA